MGVKNYDFKEVQCIVAGQQVNGFAEGDDSIQLVFDADDWALTIGSDGEGTRSKSNNESATLTLKLQMTSDFNDILNAQYQADKVSKNAVFPFMLKDSLGRELHSCETMWIQKRPDTGRGTTIGTLDWILRTDKMISNFGGNG